MALKRQSDRIAFRVTVRVEQQSKLQEFYSRNLGKGGIFLEVAGKSLPSIGSKLKLSFEVPGLAKTINVEGQVLHHHEFEDMDEQLKKTKKKGFGVQFLNLSPSDLSMVEKYITGKDLHVRS